jgi:hypothetical protein
MPIFIAALLGGLVQVAGTLVGRVLLSLGIGFVTYSGITILLDSILDQIFNNFSLLPPEIMNYIAVLQIGTCINILSSAVIIRLTLNGLTGGAISKMITK